jgi:SAM-dependent methyltransferase
MPPATDAAALLRTYPRRRPELPAAQARIYVEEYRRNRRGESSLTRIVQRLEGWMHEQMRSRQQVSSILEVGAGTLNHLPYEGPVPRYDIVEPFEELWRDSGHRERVTTFYRDIGEVPADPPYDRILSVAVLEHLTDLPSIVAQCIQRLHPEGEFAAAFPSEGGLLWGLSWRLTTGVSYRLRTGLDYAALMHHEHVNTADDIVGVLRHFFADVQVDRFPGPTRHSSFYSAARARCPRMQQAEAWLAAHFPA